MKAPHQCNTNNIKGHQMKEVIVKSPQEVDELVFIGIKDEALEVYEYLCEYHKYDNYIQAEIVDRATPKYESIADFRKDYNINIIN